MMDAPEKIKNPRTGAEWPSVMVAYDNANNARFPDDGGDVVEVECSAINCGDKFCHLVHG